MRGSGITSASLLCIGKELRPLGLEKAEVTQSFPSALTNCGRLLKSTVTLFVSLASIHSVSIDLPSQIRSKSGQQYAHGNHVPLAQKFISTCALERFSALDWIVSTMSANASMVGCVFRAWYEPHDKARSTSHSEQPHAPQDDPKAHAAFRTILR